VEGRKLEMADETVGPRSRSPRARARGIRLDQARGLGDGELGVAGIHGDLIKERRGRWARGFVSLRSGQGSRTIARRQQQALDLHDLAVVASFELRLEPQKLG